MIAVAAAVALAVAALIAARALVARRWLVVTVHGHSMLPTFHDGQRLVVRRGRRALAVGDVIVFELGARASLPGDPRYRIKRVAGVAGDPVPRWLRQRAELARLAAIPDGHVAIVGDNPRSEDSRHLGLIAETAIHAVVAAPPGGAR